jgi:hypothetical protein
LSGGDPTLVIDHVAESMARLRTSAAVVHWDLVAARRCVPDCSLQRRLLAAVASGFVLAGGAASCGGQSTLAEGEDANGGGGSGATGGSATGGSATGGSATGGSATGGSATGGSATGGTAGTTGGAPACASGGDRQCFTLEELEHQLNNPPRVADHDPPLDAGMDGPYVEVTDCLDAVDVRDGCCNPAVYGPEREDGRCCYTFCSTSCCGRPFVTGGAVRLASAAERSDWLAEELGDASEELDPLTRRALTAAWLDDARGEHASVASFARFTLELLGVGAPAELVHDAQQAALDEIEHARLCFAVVRRISGRSLGPGPLHDSGAAPRRSLAACAAAAVHEGCIGEAIAAAVAAAERDGARDPAVRQALDRIAADEASHAELAFRFVAWAIATGDADVRHAVNLAFEQALAARHPVDQTPAEVDSDAWRRFGRLTAAERSAVARSVLRDVIRPCATRLAELARSA